MFTLEQVDEIGIERWTVDTAAMTMAFRDALGNDRMVDAIV